MRRIVLALMLLVVGLLRLHAQTYAADAEALASRFENLVSQMSAAQQTRDAQSIATMRENIRNIKSRAATLEDLRTKITAAKDRVTVARQEADTAMVASERATAAVATRASNYLRERDQFIREFGDFFVSWGLPREGGQRNDATAEEVARFDAAQAPYLQRQERFRARADEIGREQAHAESLVSFSARTIAAADRAAAALSRLEDSQQTRGVEFEQILTRQTNNLSQFAGLTSFPQNAARPSDTDDMKPLIRKPPGTNTNALEQLQATKADYLKNKFFRTDCYESSCERRSSSDGSAPVEPVPVPQKVESHPAYQKAKQSVAEAEQRSQEAAARRNAAQRAGRPAEEQLRLTNDASRLKGLELMEKFKLRAQVDNLSFSIDVSSRAPKPAGPGSGQ